MIKFYEISFFNYFLGLNVSVHDKPAIALGA